MPIKQILYPRKVAGCDPIGRALVSSKILVLLLGCWLVSSCSWSCNDRLKRAGGFYCHLEDYGVSFECYGVGVGVGVGVVVVVVVVFVVF